MLRKNEVFFDIGANAGLVTMDTSMLLGETVAICACEPQPSLAESVRRSVAINARSNIKVFECLLGNRDGSADLFLTSHAIHASMLPRESSFNKVSLPVHKLDTLINDGQCPLPDVIKIDTEGAELKVLEGMAETIRRVGPAIIFEADENMSRCGYGAVDLMKMLSVMQPYRFYSVLANGKLRPWAPNIASDIMAVGPTHSDRITEEWRS